MAVPTLVEKAADAPIMMRVLFDVMHRSLVGEHPQLARADVWSAFQRMASVAGCVALSMRLHFDVHDQLRTPAELSMRQALDRAVPGGENQYEDCTQFVRASLMEFDRPSRPDVAFYLLAMWVVSKVFEDEPIAQHQKLLAVTAALFECETAGYWTTALDDARSDPFPIFVPVNLRESG